MSRARGHSLERRLCLASVAWFACLGCSSATDNGGGHAGASGGGSLDAGADSSGAGSATTGGLDAGGASAGGTSGAGTGASPGGAGATALGGKSGSCEVMECFVANTCLDKCGGSVVYIGCCSCEPPSVNKLTCSGMN